jgi:hypothetical protein
VAVAVVAVAAAQQPDMLTTFDNLLAYLPICLLTYKPTCLLTFPLYTTTTTKQTVLDLRQRMSGS